MKKLLIGSMIAALSAVGVAPQTAAARDSEVLAALGGFIGGVIVGSHIDDDHYHASISYRHVDRDYGTHVVVGTGRGSHRGYWKWVTVRTWVPGHWVIRSDERCRRIRSFQRGYYKNRRERVWVAAGRDRRHRDRYDG